MKKTRFTEEQMVTILREADEKPVPEVAKKHGVSAQTIYGWRKHFGSLEPADVKRLRQLEQENGRLKKLVADRDLEHRCPQGDHAKKMVGARVRRQQVPYAQTRGLSAAARAPCCPSPVDARLSSRRLVVRDAPVVDADATPGRTVSAVRLSHAFGSSSSARGTSSSADRTHRLWRQAGLQVPRRRPRRRVARQSSAAAAAARAQSRVGVRLRLRRVREWRRR